MANNKEKENNEPKTGTVKVNFNFVLKDLDNKPILNSDGPANVGKMMARVISSMSQGDIFKMMEWSRKCYHGETLELNPKEKKDLYDLIEKSEVLTVLSKEQILAVINDAS